MAQSLQGGLPSDEARRSAWKPIITWLREDETIRLWLTDAEAEELSGIPQDLPIWKALLTYKNSTSGD
jgi:hypothetical protein